MADLPGSVLFACSENAIRSPMAEAMLKTMHGRRIFVDSVGVRAGGPDLFLAIALDEIGIERRGHRPKTFDDLEDAFFDVIISLSPEAHHRAVELTRSWPCEIEFWNMPDPSRVEGSRELVLDAYRELRGQLALRLRRRFPGAGSHGG